MKAAYLLLVCCLASATACTSRQEKAEQSASAAMALANAGNFAAARAAILAAIGQRDDIASQWKLLGRIELEAGNPEDALFAYSRALELDPSNKNALELVAELSFQFDKDKEAISAADRLLALDPNSTRGILVKGLVALNRRRASEVLNAANSILAINPHDEFGIVLKARAFAIGTDYEGALRLIEDGVPEGQRTEASLATLTELYRTLGDSDHLVATLDKRLSLRPRDAGLRLDLARVLYKTGDMERARAILLQVLKSQPDNIEMMQEITGIWQESDPAALAPSQLAEIARNGSATVRVGVARYLIARNRPDLAEPILRDAPVKSSDVSATDVQALYAAAMFEQGNVKVAKTVAGQILESDKNNADALLVRARIGLQERNLVAALNDAQIVVRDFPMNEQGRIVLAEIYLAKNEILRATQSYEDAVNQMPQSLIVHRSYAQYLVHAGNMARAIDVARAFTRKSPSSVPGWELLTSVCAQAADRSCSASAQAGRARAAAIYTIDDRPGLARSRGLLGRL